jgi:hypothetical protein
VKVAVADPGSRGLHKDLTGFRVVRALYLLNDERLFHFGQYGRFHFHVVVNSFTAKWFLSVP